MKTAGGIGHVPLAQAPLKASILVSPQNRIAALYFVLPLYGKEIYLLHQHIISNLPGTVPYTPISFNGFWKSGKSYLQKQIFSSLFAVSLQRKQQISWRDLLPKIIKIIWAHP